MPSVLTSILLGAALLLSACTHVRVTTRIRSDGSWTRTLALSGQQKGAIQPMPTLEDTFVVPSGDGWKSSEESKDNNHTLTLERTLASGATLQGDISIKASNASEPGKLRLGNTVTRP